MKEVILMSKNKPDDRRDNAQKIQKAIDNTKHNMELADEMIARASDDKTKADLKAKNERRDQAIEPMKREMQEENENK